MLEAVQRLIAPGNLGSTERETKKLQLLAWDDAALVMVDAQLGTLVEEPRMFDSNQKARRDKIKTSNESPPALATHNAALHVKSPAR